MQEGRASLILGRLVPNNVHAARCGESTFHHNLVGRQDGQVGRRQHRAGYSPVGDKQQRKQPKHAKINGWGSGSGDTGESRLIGRHRRGASSSKMAHAVMHDRQGRLFVALPRIVGGRAARSARIWITPKLGRAVSSVGEEDLADRARDTPQARRVWPDATSLSAFWQHTTPRLPMWQR